MIIDDETNESLAAINEIFIHLSNSFKKLGGKKVNYDVEKSDKFIENSSELSKENKEIEDKIEIISRKSELEFKLLKNEIECYSKIESKSKYKATEAFSILQKKYDKFRN